MKQDLGNAVLLDNSTVYGAMEAFETPPQQLLRGEGAGPGAAAAKFHALMDILEGIVLYQNLVVEPRQGDVDLWYELTELRGSDGKEILLQRPIEDNEVRPILIRATLDRLEEYVRSVDFRADATSFVRGLKDSAIPEVYTQEYDLDDGIRRDFKFYLERDDLEQLELISYQLGNATQADRNYAAFAFGGLFYQAVAKLYSVSYVPHTWRSALVDREMTRGRLDFGKLAIDLAGEVRQALTTRLNNEFGRTAIKEDFPVVASYVISQADRRSDLLRTAVEIRDTEPARAFRQWVADVQSALRDQRDLPLINRANQELQDLAEDLKREFDVHDRSSTQDFTVKAHVPGEIVSADTTVGVEKSAPTWVRPILDRQTYFVFLRDMAGKSVSLPPFIQRFQKMPT
jgi:hypothetical protein